MKRRDLGVCLIDIGCGTTDIAIFTDGTIKHTAVIPIGSQMITNDIRIILCTSLSAAEEIKIQYGCVTSDIDLEVKIPVPSVSDKPDTETTKKLYYLKLYQHALKRYLTLYNKKLIIVAILIK